MLAATTPSRSCVVCIPRGISSSIGSFGKATKRCEPTGQVKKERTNSTVSSVDKIREYFRRRPAVGAPDIDGWQGREHVAFILMDDDFRSCFGVISYCLTCLIDFRQNTGKSEQVATFSPF